MNFDIFFKNMILSLLLALISTLIITYIYKIPYENYYEKTYTDSYHIGSMSSKYPTGIPTGYIDQGGDKSKYFDNNKEKYYIIFALTFVFWFALFFIIIKIDNRRNIKNK